MGGFGDYAYQGKDGLTVGRRCPSRRVMRIGRSGDSVFPNNRGRHRLVQTSFCKEVPRPQQIRAFVQGEDGHPDVARLNW
jgi:hypothetical protein